MSDINRALTPAIAKNTVAAKSVAEDSTGKGAKAGNKKGKKKR
jgi:hypothetical protein